MSGWGLFLFFSSVVTLDLLCVMQCLSQAEVLAFLHESTNKSHTVTSGDRHSLHEIYFSVQTKHSEAQKLTSRP